MSRLQLVSALAASLALAACSEHAAKTAERSTSPLIGTWTRDGNVPQANGAAGPQFTKLTFAADGKLQASYVAGGVGAALGAAPAVKNENDTYTVSGDTLSIAEGSRHLEYGYRVDGGKLYLTPPGGSEAAVFSRG